MPAAKCAVCGKTAYPLESVTAIEKTYHKSCFKCAVCRLQLTLTNFVGDDGKVYCKKHAPVAKATQVTDTVAIRQATHAPKRVAEGLGTAQKGTGEKPRVAGDSMAMQHVKAAPKRTAEGLGTVQKGTGDKATAVTDDFSMQHTRAAPKRAAEGLGTVQKGTGGKPSVVCFSAPSDYGEGVQSPTADSGYNQEGASYEQPAESYEEQPAESYDQPAESYEEQPAETYEEQPAESYDQGGYEEQPAESYDQGGEGYGEEQPAGEEYYEEQY